MRNIFESFDQHWLEYIYIYVLPTGEPFMGVGTGAVFLIPIEKPIPF
jgi:hypothetical protein